MKRKAPQKPAISKAGLAIRPADGAPLSRTQVEFNRLIKSLEATKARHLREQERLDKTLVTAIRELVPLVEELNRLNCNLIFTGMKAFQSLKLTAHRRLWFADLLSTKAGNLLVDPVGLNEQEIHELEAIIKKLSPDKEDSQMNEGYEKELSAARVMMEQAARLAGLDLDLSDLDPRGDPEEFHRIANERLRDAFQTKQESATDGKPGRKPTKAQAENERKRLAKEDAKNRDLKSLFKQLAKAFHPDLEPDPLLKEHKKIWMQRLNAAYAADDLREMLQLEMEWLGEEATNLATAGDQKLQVYCMVLKEQILDLKGQIYRLPFEPQYGPLRRFILRGYDTIPSPVSIKRGLQDDLDHYEGMLEILTANNAASRRMIYDWTDEHAHRSTDLF